MTTPDNILVGSGGNVYIAPVGTTSPTTPTGALDAAFASVGYISEDGITLSAAVDVTDVNAYQSLLPVRRIVTGRTFDLSFVIREWTADNIAFAFGGGAVTEPSPGIFQYDPPAVGDALYERSMVVDWQDGSKNYRLVVERGVATEAVETNITRSGAADLPITFSVLDNSGTTYYLLTDDPAMTPAGS